MGKIMGMYELEESGASGVLKPLIYCASDNNILDKAISIEGLITNELLKIKPKYRNKKIPVCFDNVLKILQSNAVSQGELVISGIDVLFNPSYQIDVLRMMILACKRCEFSVIWPGKYSDGSLIYAENGYVDYKVYNVDDYDITCII